MRGFWQGVLVAAAVLLAAAGTAANAQPPVARPQPPPPVPGSQAPAKLAPPVQTPASPRPAAPGSTPVGVRAGQSASTPAAADADAAPSPAMLNAPVFPTAQYLGAYDAGQGQSFYLYGCTQSFVEIVAYYRSVLKDKGELVFDAPAVHMFDVGRFKETEVAFPPGVTVKDYTWGGAPGYLNPRPGGSPAYFPTVIQIVPPPPALAGRAR